MRLFASQKRCASGLAFTISYDAQCAMSGLTCVLTCLSSIQSVVNSGWLGPRNALVSGFTAARRRVRSAAGNSIRRSFMSARRTPYRAIGASAWMSHGCGRGSL